MSLDGKRVAKVKIESDSHLFLELWKTQQHKLPSLLLTVYQNCQPLGDEVGVLCWNYILDGKDCVAKTLIIDEDENSVTYKVLEGDLMELYKTFIINILVETQGSHNLVTWTVNYEKLNPNVPDPDTVMDLYRKITKDIEAQHLQK